MITPIDELMKVTLATALGPPTKRASPNPWYGLEDSSSARSWLQLAIVVPPGDVNSLPGLPVSGGAARCLSPECRFAGACGA